MKTQINNTVYYIVEFDKGQWCWTHDKDESSDTYGSDIEALRAAIDFEQALIDEKNFESDNYRHEVNESWNKRDFV